jgi:hypothetical protein
MRDTCTCSVFLDSRDNEGPVRGSKPTTSITTSDLSRAGFGVLRCIDLCSFGGIIFISSKLTFAFSPHSLKIWTVVQLTVSVEGRCFSYFQYKYSQLRHKKMALTRLKIFVFKIAISQVIWIARWRNQHIPRNFGTHLQGCTASYQFREWPYCKKFQICGSEMLTAGCMEIEVLRKVMVCPGLFENRSASIFKEIQSKK